MEFDLVVVSVAELGFKDGAIYKDICERAVEYGLELCPAEVGFQLRLAYDNQPKDEWLLIAMEAVRDSDGYLRIFSVGEVRGGLWLDGGYGYSDGFWDGLSRFVFVRPRSPLAEPKAKRANSTWILVS